MRQARLLQQGCQPRFRHACLKNSRLAGRRQSRHARELKGLRHSHVSRAVKRLVLHRCLAPCTVRGAFTRMNAAVQGSMTALHSAHAVSVAGGGTAGSSVRRSRQTAHSRMWSRTGADSSSVRTAPCARMMSVPMRRENASPSTTSSKWCTATPAISIGASTYPRISALALPTPMTSGAAHVKG